MIATFNEKRTPAYRKYIVEQGIMMPNLWQTLQSFWSHSSVFTLGKLSENSMLTVLLHLKKTLAATFNETRAHTSRKDEAEQSIMMANLWQTL